MRPRDAQLPRPAAGGGAATPAQPCRAHPGPHSELPAAHSSRQVEISPQWFRVVAVSDALACATGTQDVPIPDEALAHLAPAPADVRRSLDDYAAVCPPTPADGVADALKCAIHGAESDAVPGRLRLGAAGMDGATDALQRILRQQPAESPPASPAVSCKRVLQLASSWAADPDSAAALLAAALRGWVTPALLRAQAEGGGEEIEALCAAARSLFRALLGSGSPRARALCADAVRRVSPTPASSGTTRQAGDDSAGTQEVAAARAGAFLNSALRAAAAEDR